MTFAIATDSTMVTTMYKDQYNYGNTQSKRVNYSTSDEKVVHKDRIPTDIF